jgi:cystathionine beta-synthase
VEVAKEMKEGQRVVVLLADSIRNYMTKHLNDGWMVDGGFMEDNSDSVHGGKWWAAKTVADLKLSAPVTVGPSVTAQQCIDLMRAQGFDQVPVVSDAHAPLGMVSLGNLTSQLISGRAQADQPVSSVMYKQFKSIPLTTTLAQLSRVFEKDHFALVTTSQKCYSAGGMTEKIIVFGVVSHIDLLNYMVENAPKDASAL